MATMLEVAKRAGVSKATVSRVLSGNGYVSQETKDRVFKAVAESGYRPNLLARNLATKTTQTLGLVVTNTLYHGVYFSELLYHVARMTEDKGRQLILADGKHSAQEEREAIQYLLDLRCDAIIIYPRFLTVDEMDEIVENHSQPIMVLNRRLRRHASHCVWSDQKASAMRVVERLIALMAAPQLRIRELLPTRLIVRQSAWPVAAAEDRQQTLAQLKALVEKL